MKITSVFVRFPVRMKEAMLLLIFAAWASPLHAGGLPCPGNCIGGTNHGEPCVTTNPDCPGAGAVCQTLERCVYLEWRPQQVTVPPGGVAELNLYAYSSDDSDQVFEAIDVILNWDETRLQFLGKRDPCQACSGGANDDQLCADDADCPDGACALPDGCFEDCPAQTYGWHSSFFPPDCGLDGLNAPCPGGPANDGDAFYQAFSQAFCGQEESPPAMAPPLGDGSGGLHVTTFLFQPTISVGQGALVSIPLDQGEYTHTRVFGGTWGFPVLGFIGPAAQIIVSNACDSPTVTALGCRYIGVTPAPASQQPVAIRVRGSSADAAVSCVVRYVQADGTLGSTAVYRTPVEWGTVPVRGAEIQPSKSYRLQTDCAEPPGTTLSNVVNVTLRPWGDATGTGLPITFQDISRVVDGFRGVAGISIEETDMVGPNCIPQRFVNFADISATADAFRGILFPCSAPCP